MLWLVGTTIDTSEHPPDPLPHWRIPVVSRPGIAVAWLANPGHATLAAKRGSHPPGKPGYVSLAAQTHLGVPHHTACRGMLGAKVISDRMDVCLRVGWRLPKPATVVASVGSLRITAITQQGEYLSSDRVNGGGSNPRLGSNSGALSSGRLPTTFSDNLYLYKRNCRKGHDCEIMIAVVQLARRRSEVS